MMRPVSNPPNPWSSSEIEYLEEIPEAQLEVYEDHTKNILAENDSPDIGFSFSVNPYRGCYHGCAYCMAGDTLVLMADDSTKTLRDIRVGDAIYGTRRVGSYRRFVETRVLAHWETRKLAYRVRLEDGSELIASGEHRFLTSHGWKYVTGKRPHLIVGDRLRAFAYVPPMQPLCTRDQVAFMSSSPVLEDEPSLRVLAIEATGIEMPMFDITTGTGDFIANGVVSHNCYARPGHEYLSFGAGTDFERKIVVKPNAPSLLREAFDKKSWQGELVMFSGVTDCYQPLEASLELTRGCLQVCAEYKNPVGIITKAPLIERDLDLLARLHEVASVHVMMSIPFWDADRARAIEPFVATPQRRMKALRRLAEAKIPVGVMVAPMIPGLNDEDMPRVLEAAAEAGARSAGTVFLRLPGSVKQVFEERVRQVMPLRAEKILKKVREARGGKMYNPTPFLRQRGEGPYAESARMLFESACKRLGLNADEERYAERPKTFARPPKAGDQLKLL
jgi:DNA repair photolyase